MLYFKYRMKNYEREGMNGKEKGGEIMALTKEDLQALSQLMDVKLDPIKADVSGLKKDMVEVKSDVSGLKKDILEVKDIVSRNYDKTLEFYGKQQEYNAAQQEQMEEMQSLFAIYSRQTVRNTTELRQIK